MKKLMTGNEAIARGVYEAGVHFAAAYPGTPSTEILENLALYKDVKCEWSPNEKVAFEAAVGASLAGGRAFATMKHVGINVAADAMFTFAYMGVNGGMVFISADEPGQHSSQNEQDNRNYAKMARIPMLEPSDSQECLSMVKQAFEISERFDMSVMIRLTTRVCHSKSFVECSDRVNVEIREYVKNVRRTVTVPAIAKQMRIRLEQKVIDIRAESEVSHFNKVISGDKKIGVICSGMCYYYAREVFGDTATYLKLGMTYPLPDKMIESFCKSVEKIYVIEENDPYIEEAVKILGFKPHGSDILPFCDEKTPDVLRKCIFGEELPSNEATDEMIIPRPPMLCAGCPHRGFYYQIGKRKNVMVSGDIGCYTLGFAPPYNAMDSNLCMGASISLGHGAQTIFSMKKDCDKRVVAVIGDSTFLHTGVNSLMDVVYNGSKTITVILDNRITGMTGHQENPGSGYTIMGEETNEISIEALVKAVGIKNIKTIDPNDLKAVNEALDWAFALDEASVIITRWPCVLKKFSKEDNIEFPNAFTVKYKVTEDCIGCKICLKCGCPALSLNASSNKTAIDKTMCVGCSVCSQTCPKKAIVKEGN